MMKNTKKVSKSAIWTGSIVAAFVAAVAVFAVMLQMEKNVMANYEKGVIYVASRKIPRGQVITQENYVDYLVSKELDVNCIPQTALSNVEQITGLLPTADIEEGVLLTLGMFRERNAVTEGMKEPVIAGFKADDIYQVVGVCSAVGIMFMSIL